MFRLKKLSDIYAFGCFFFAFLNYVRIINNIKYHKASGIETLVGSRLKMISPNITTLILKVHSFVTTSCLTELM